MSVCEHVYVGACTHTCKCQRRMSSALCGSLPSFSHDTFFSLNLDPGWERDASVVPRLADPQQWRLNRDTSTPSSFYRSQEFKLKSSYSTIKGSSPLNYLSSPYIDHFMVYVRRHQDGLVGKVWQLETSPQEPQMGWENRLLQSVFSSSSGFHGICAYTHMQINVV